jgi:hypothetical protein
MAEAATIVPSVEADLGHHDEHDDPKVALTPPTSDDMGKREERMSSELSELNSDDDDEEIEPDHYFEGGKIPVFKPVSRAPSRSCGSRAQYDYREIWARDCADGERA